MINNHVAVNRIESNRIVSNRIEPNRIESNRIESDRIRKGTKNFSPERNELRERNETKRVISFFFFFFSSLRIQVSLNIAPRDAIRAAREISSSKEWKTRARVRYFLEMQITYGEEDGGIRIRQRGEREGGKNVNVEERGEVLSMLGSPKHPRRPMHARFFPWATQKSRRVACTGEGFVAIVRPYDDRLIKKRFVAVNRGTRIYAALCTSYSSRITNSHMRRENLANTSVKTLPPLFLSFFFFHRRFRNWRRPKLGCYPHPWITSILYSLDFLETFACCKSHWNLTVS